MRDREPEREHGRDHDRHVWGAAQRAQTADSARYLPVGGERVRQPGEAEHLAVDRDQQGGRRGGTDQVAARVDEPFGLVRVHDAEDRRLHEAAAERRRTRLHRLSHQRRRADDHEEQQRDRRRQDHNAAQATPAHPHLAGEARGRLDPDQRHAGDAEGEDRVLPLRRLAQLDGVRDRTHVEELGERDHAHRHQHDDRGERHAQCRSEPASRDAADVDRCHEQQREPGDEHLDEAVVDARFEHGQVVGDDDRTRRHHDQVVEQDRPAGDEAPELVEGVARERRGAAPLDMERGALDVGGHRDGEEEPGDHVDERRQPERVAGDDAEREEHRGDDGAQRDGEQRGLAQPARDPQPRSLGALAEPLARPQRGPDAGVAHPVRPRASSAASASAGRGRDR